MRTKSVKVKVGNNFYFEGPNGERWLVDKNIWESFLGDYVWSSNGTGYASSRGGGKLQTLHRLIMNPEDNESIDHINGNIMDNRRENLRICTIGDNCKNRSKSVNRYAPGLMGISWHKQSKRWRARIMPDGKEIALGLFKTRLEAVRAYASARKMYFKNFSEAYPTKEQIELAKRLDKKLLTPTIV